jgi:putative addiction module component (TIGR02574 family)
MDKAALLEELKRLASEQAAAPLLSDAQRQELRSRLAHHRARPDEPGVTLEDIRRKLG